MEDEDDFTDWLIDREECIMDLDYEELEATRKLNGVAKENNIEENLKELKNCLAPYQKIGFDSIISKKEKYFKSLEQVIEEREINRNRIKELEEENSDLKIKNNSRIIGSYAEVRLEEILKEDYIPVQKVKDKIEENKRLIDETYSEDIIQKLTDENEILEELLEDK